MLGRLRTNTSFLIFQPQRDHNEFLILYFISFLLIVSFFVLNMFVGVVVENFHKCREQQAAEEMARRLEKRRKKIELAKQRREKLRRKMLQRGEIDQFLANGLFVLVRVECLWSLLGLGSIAVPSNSGGIWKLLVEVVVCVL